MAAYTNTHIEIQNVDQYVTCYCNCSLNAFSLNGWNEIC